MCEDPVDVKLRELGMTREEAEAQGMMDVIEQGIKTSQGGAPSKPEPKP